MAGARNAVRVCRGILRELKKADPEHGGIPQWQYITSQVRRHQDDTSLQQLLQTYLTYIESSRLHRELLSRYQGKGERSVEESAKLVGLRLPNTNPR